MPQHTGFRRARRFRRGDERRLGKQALVDEQLLQRVGRLVGAGAASGAAARQRTSAVASADEAQARRGGRGFASARSIGERASRASIFETMLYLRAAAAPERSGTPFHGPGRRCAIVVAARPQRTNKEKHDVQGFAAREGRHRLSRAARGVDEGRPAGRRRHGRASSTRRSTTRTRWRSPTRARSCAAGRWSPASTAPAPCSRAAIRRGRPGDRVVLNGWGVGETHWGCLARARPPEGRLAGARCPRRFTTRQAMAIGTAGYTAMLCVLALERHGVKPGDGDGARHRRDRRRRQRRDRAARASSATASSPRPARPPEADYLRELGAAEIDRPRRARARPASRCRRSAGRR